MRVRAEYHLPVSEQPSDYEYEGPIFIAEQKVYFATATFEHPQEVRAKDNKRRGSVLTIHAIDLTSGRATAKDCPLPQRLLPGSWSFFHQADRLFLHCGYLLAVSPEFRLIDFPYTTPQATKAASRPRILLLDGNAVFADEKTALLYSFSLAGEAINWELDLKGDKPYRTGAPLPFDDEITCHGRDCLNFIDPATGSIGDVLRLPRIDKLYSPLRVEDDLILGYTNWSAGGVVRYDPFGKRVRWQYRKRFSGPASYGRIHRVGDVIIWVKGETEIIGTDADTGQEKWTYPASPWLYTEIDVFDGDLVFGTAGRDGYLQRVDASTGKAKWSVFLKNGCAYFDYYQDSILVGDFESRLHRISVSDGREIDRLEVNGQVVGDVKVAGDVACTVVWFGQDGTPPRLVLVDLK